ncbi:YsnF/AvaK domain-containing protein [Quadrisphaera sp. INWT6]|uniref:YsnF/AvaK domain-containing protein n=1 Tax=Quadrisphaera sp. INWT6 TaxID=2596917 RepID=UPI00189215DE|nr:YsnF/AvaK domain-containing protein [Quadrisphaera sp. INWT6]
MALSAERIDIAVHRLPRERMRLRREIHTREVEVRVTVRREVLRIERSPVEDGGVVGPTAGTTAPTEPSLDFVLLEERPVVGVEVVPYERVRIGVDVVPSTSQVDTTVAREVLDLTFTPAAPATATEFDEPSTTTSATTND